jgi:hypothetical protein
MQTTNKTVLAYLRKIGRTGGQSKSDAKRAACRANGRKKKREKTACGSGSTL